MSFDDLWLIERFVLKAGRKREGKILWSNDEKLNRLKRVGWRWP